MLAGNDGQVSLIKRCCNVQQTACDHRVASDSWAGFATGRSAGLEDEAVE